MKTALLTLAEIIRATRGISNVSDCDQERIVIDQVIIDSRSAGQGENRLFVALVTRKNDGHRYIRSAYESGIRYFLVSQYIQDSDRYPGAIFVRVSDTRGALQALAGFHRRKFTVPVVGITGSNGKTIVKEWLAFLLGFDRNIVRSPQSYNSQTGVPLSVLQMQPEHELAVFEAGISESGEMAALREVMQPTCGIITNIGSAHDSGFRNRAEKTAEKLKLFATAQTVIYRADYTEITEQIRQDPAFGRIEVRTWSMDSGLPADLRITDCTVRPEGTLVRALYKGDSLSVEIPFSDQASIENAIHCWLFMLAMGYENALIADRLRHLPAVEMRMEIKEGVGNSYLINDVYNSDYTSFCIALDFLCNHRKNQPKCVILSDILQTGRTEDALYGDVADMLRRRKIDEFVGIGEAMERQQTQFKGLSARFYPDTDAFLASFSQETYFGKAVLLKGARIFRLERIGALLQRQLHETVMEVNLTALVHNLDYFRSLIRPQTKLMVMGKAFSYGSGSHEIADILEFNGVDYVAVAYPDEAIALRNSGVRLPVMCMNPEEDGLETLLRYDVEPVIYSFRILHNLQRYLHLQPCRESGPVRIHIALDTGMHRMGFEEPDLAALVSVLQQEPHCRIQSVFTHLATADMPEMEPYTLRQLELYTRMSEYVQAGFPYRILRHCLNTAGIFRFPEYQFDMVRLGIGLYGVGTDEKMQKNLEIVSTLKTVISQVRTIEAGEAVSYGRRFVARRETRVGVIGIGYADGLNRHLGNGRGRVWVRGKLVPIIGSICMDMCMIDLTDTDAGEKDEVIVFGKQNPVSELAAALDTIPYEILTGISQRVKRVYIQE